MINFPTKNNNGTQTLNTNITGDRLTCFTMFSRRADDFLLLVDVSEGRRVHHGGVHSSVSISRGATHKCTLLRLFIYFLLTRGFEDFLFRFHFFLH